MSLISATMHWFGCLTISKTHSQTLLLSFLQLSLLPTLAMQFQLQLLVSTSHYHPVTPTPTLPIFLILFLLFLHFVWIMDLVKDFCLTISIQYSFLDHPQHYLIHFLNKVSHTNQLIFIWFLGSHILIFFLEFFYSQLFPNFGILG